MATECRFVLQASVPQSAIRLPKLDGGCPEHLQAMRATMINARNFGGKESDTPCVSCGLVSLLSAQSY